jgi:beta-glucanase (GH16 family)
MNLKLPLLVVALSVLFCALVHSEKVSITQDTPADLVIGGNTIGSTKLKAGQTFDMVSRETDFFFLQMGGATIKVPAAVCEVQAAATPAPASPPPAPAPAPVADAPTSSAPASTLAPAPANTPAPAPTPAKPATPPANNSSLPSQFQLSKGEATVVSKDKQVPNPNWKLVWSDEFDGTTVDKSKWQYEVNGDGGGNGEMQYYVDNPKNSTVANGMLTISALKEDYKGKKYTSARLKSKGKGDFKYGRIEARLKLPVGTGMWPAFWMMPTDAVYGGWARSGEIDIMENVGKDPNTVYGTLHFGGGWPKNVHHGDKISVSGGPSKDFHIYAVEWEQGEIRWYLDNKLYQTQNKGWYSEKAPFPAPFDQKFFIILNVAVGGAWPGPPNEATKFPQTMQVDYVRVYQP